MGRALDIAIAGCGPAGLSSALRLHALGHKVLLLDQFEAVRPVGSGLMLQTTGLAVLADMGLDAAIRAVGQPIRRLHGRSEPSGRTVLDVRFPAPDSSALAVHRAGLFRVLHDAVLAAGVDVATGVRVTDLDRAADRRPVLVDDRGRRHGPFDLVVDALGARSPLRVHAAKPFLGRRLPYGALWASLPVRPEDPFSTDMLDQRYRRASVMVGVLPVGRIVAGEPDQWTVFWSLKPEAYDGWRAAGLDGWKAAVCEVWPAMEGLLDRIEHPGQMSLAVYGHHTLPLPYGDRIAFVGDSAHSTSPQLGQGANMALLDTTALHRAIQAAPDLGVALVTYARLRRFHIRAYQAFSTVFTPFYQSDGAALPFVRDRLFAPVSTVPGVAGLLTRLVSGRLPDPLPGLGLDLRRSP